MKNSIFVACHPLIGPVLARELKRLNFNPGKISPAGVEVRGSFSDAIYLNLNLTTANRVLYQVAGFRAHNLDQLYKRTHSVAWEKLLPVNGYFSVSSVVRQPGIRDFRVANLKVKDAIVDRMRKVYGKRPDTGPDMNKAVVFLHWEKDGCRLYLDTSGESIAKHGYRRRPFKAPLQEALASALLIRTGWSVERPFVNPMCGSGTLAIEAALLATARKPGLFRENYGFMHVREYNEAVYRKYLSELKQQVRHTDAKIIASDHDPQAIKAARLNARAAGVEDLIEFHTCDFGDTPIPDDPGTIIFNPEYGERLGSLTQLLTVYKGIGDFMKQNCPGYAGYVFTGNLDLAKEIGLRTKSRTPFLNGRIECRLLEYELYSGTKKSRSK